MEKCKKFQPQLLWLVYDELNSAEKAEIEAHLKICASCRKELARLKAFHQVVPQESLIQAEEETLQLFRRDLSFKLRRLKTENGAAKWRGFSFVHPKPVFQWGFVAVLVLLGFLAGRSTLQPVPPQIKSEFPVEQLLSFNQPVKFRNGEINPFLGSVQRIKLNPESGEIEIFYNTVSDVRLQGNLENPTIQTILEQALQEESNPAVRLHAVKAISEISAEQPGMAESLQAALLNLLKEEKNQGIRLQILHALKNMELNDKIKNGLVRVLFFDPNPALRIEAFEILTKQLLSTQDIDNIVKGAQKDSNEFIRFQATQLLKNLSNQNKNNQINSISIERKE